WVKRCAIGWAGTVPPKCGYEQGTQDEALCDLPHERERRRPHPGQPLAGDYAGQIRMKMMTLPGEQFVLRRKAYAMVSKAFDANGIKFAFPIVQVAGETEAAGATVAQHALELTRPAAA